MKRFETILSLMMLLFAIAFNLWLYRLEPTAKIDPNDNTFQFALVDRTNQVWDFAQRSCVSQKSKVQSTKFSLVTTLTYPVLCTLDYVLLVDHWVPNWAEGYNLPFYYSHIPQILIVGSYRIVNFIGCQLSAVSCQLSLFQYYHLIIYLLLSLFPLSVFLALLVLQLSPITAGVGALLATHLSTDGLYGLDPSSFLWRGYGLSSQLFAMIFLPLAIAYSYRFFNDDGERGKKFFEELKIRLKALYKGHLATNFHLARHEKYSNDQKSSDRASSKNNFPERLNFASQKNSSTKSFALSVFFLFATTAGHLGIGIIALLSLPVLAFAKPLMMLLKSEPLSRIFETSRHEATKLLLLLAMTLFFLSYWIVPIVLNNNYHNISFWDPIWKFNSYGWKETLIRLFNGDLFDFGRLPILTVLVFLGFFVSLLHKKRDMYTVLRITENSDNNTTPPILHNTYPYSPLAFLFPFWLLLYFGRTTWGGLIDLIPGMKEFHLSRFLVGIHVTGLFLVPLGIEAIVLCIMEYVLRIKEKFKLSILHNTFPIIHLFITSIFLIIVLPPIYQQTIKYNDLNNTLIRQANENFMKVKPDVDELFRTLEPLKYNGRVFAGRGGGWGKDFQVAETPYYMHLSTYGINTVLWLPETWSLNSDTEQYFSEDQIKDYELYNIRYVVAPPSQKPQPFWKLINEAKSWKLYEVTRSVIPAPARIDTRSVSGRQAGIQSQKELIPDQVGNDTNNFGYFTSGIRPAIVAVDKESFINVVRLWIQSDYPKRGLYPELTFDKNYPKNTGLPNFKMIDEANYVIPARNASASVAGGPDGTRHNLFAEPPVYLPPSNATIQQFNNVTILSQTNDSDMIFTAKISVPKDCLECIVILKETSHPNWQVTIDGKRAERLDVFPFYNAVKISEGLPAQTGTHEVIFSYQPSSIKIVLLVLEIFVLIFLILNKATSKQLKEI